MDPNPIRTDDTVIKRGDIVWVRVHFPHKWCPALVLSSTNLTIHVTFSFFPDDAVSPSTHGHYFLPSDVFPFEQFFSSFVSHVSPAHAPVLHSALRLFGQRLLAGFRCPCVMPYPRAHSQRAPNGPHFDPVGLFGFVLDSAVSPRLHPPRFARAVGLVAQLHAFRAYSSMHRKKVYQQTQYTGDNVKLLPSSSSGQMMQSVTQESVVLEPKEKFQIISKYGEKNIALGAIRRLNSSVSDCEGNSRYSYKNKLMFISENLMHSVSLDPLYMVQERLKSERQSLLGFKYTSDQGLADICFGNSFTMSETHISVPLNFKIHLSNYIDKSEDNALELCCRLPDAETIVFLNSKRRRLDKPASCHVLSEIGEVQESDRDAYISEHTRPLISHIKKFEPEGGIQKEHQSSTCFWGTTTNVTDEDNALELCCRLPDAETIVFLNSKRRRLDKPASCHVLSEIGEVQESDRDAYISEHTRPLISHIKKFEPEGGIQKEHQSSTCFWGTTTNVTNEDNALELCCRLPDAETIVFLNSKRRRLDKPASCHVLSEIGEVQESDRDAYISEHTRPLISHIKKFEPEGGIQKEHQSSTCFWETTTNLTDEDNALELCCRLPDAETTIFLNSKRKRLDKPASCHVLSEIGEVQESDRDAYISEHTRPLISHIKKFEPEGGIQEEHQSSTCFWETTTNLTDEVQKVDLKKSGDCKSLSNPLLCFHSTKCEVHVSAATVKGMLGSDSSVYQERLQISCNDDTTPLEAKISARIALSSGDHLVEGKDCYEGVASCFIFNSKVGQPSNTEVPLSPKSLYMKFPRNFNLPTKEQLIRQFSVFGTVDSCRTRVFCYTGSAQVAFLQEMDAVAAYQYAKRKAWFGDANVRFWLDPFEHKRGFKCFAHIPPSASIQIEPPPKLCLQNSNSWRQDNSNKYFSGKYMTPSASKQIRPPLKSCLKNSNSSRQEKCRKHRSLRYTAPPASKEVELPLKSCLKKSNSNPWRQENRKKHCSVRYTAPSASRQIRPPLKSCLKNSNSSRQENRKKNLRVRFTIVT